MLAVVTEIELPQLAVTGDARGRDEIELVVIDRVPRAVFRPLEAGHVSALAISLDLGPGEIVDVRGRVGGVADRHQIEMRAVHRLGSEIGLELHTSHLDTVHAAAGEAGLVDREAGRLLVANIEVDLAPIVSRKRRAAAAITGRRRVVEHRHHGLVAGESIGELVLVRHVAEPGELIAVAVLRPTDDVRHRPTFGVVLLAVEEEPTVGGIEAETGRRIVEGVGVGQVRRAEPTE